MTEQQIADARAAAESQFLTDAIDGNRFLNLIEQLRRNPGAFWDAYFSADEQDHFRQLARRLMAEHGPNLTFADVQRIMRTEARNARMCRTQRK